MKYILSTIIAIVFGSGGFFIKGCQSKATLKSLEKTIKDKDKIIEKTIKDKDKIISKYADSVTVLKKSLASCQADSSIMQGQNNGLQKNALYLKNGNIRLKSELDFCEESMKKAIETGIIEVKEKKTFFEKIFKKK